LDRRALPAPDFRGHATGRGARPPPPPRRGAPAPPGAEVLFVHTLLQSPAAELCLGGGAPHPR
ncbi:hypothetical protein ACFXHD_27160, partial [Streptomyces hydrogenans]